MKGPTATAILAYLAKRPYIKANALCVHLGIPEKVIAKARSGAQELPEKYVSIIAKELGLTT